MSIIGHGNAITMIGAIPGSGGGSTPSTLLDGLVSYWSMDGASGNAIDSVGSNDLTENGTVSRVAGKVGNCAQDLTDANYFSLDSNSEIDLYNKSFTYSLWVGNSEGSNRFYLVKGVSYSGSNNQIYISSISTGGPGFRCEVSSGGSNRVESGILASTTFKHVVVTFDLPTKTLSIHVNGNKTSGTTLAVPPNSGGALRVGKFYSDGFSAQADVDEIGFWNRVLTDPEISELFSNGLGNPYPFTSSAPIGDELVVIGDSTVAAFSGQNAVSSYLTWPGTTVDIAVPGDSIAEQLSDWIAGGRGGSNIVMIQVGLNDMNPAEAASVAIARLQGLVNQIAFDIPAARIVICTLTPAKQRWIDLYGETDGATAQTKWEDMNEAIEGNGPNAITGVDARVSSHTAALSDVDGNLDATYDLGDGIHENNAGREIVAAAWQVAIDAL